MRSKLLWSVAGVASLTVSSAALASIDNVATATASYGGEEVSSSDDASVDVSPAAPGLSIVKTAGEVTTELGAATDRVDAGDTITFTFTIENTGNVTLENVTPVDPGPMFAGQPGTGTMSGFVVSGSAPEAAATTLAPDESAIFTATYTLSDLDVLLAADVADGVTNTATASGSLIGGGTYEETDGASVSTSLGFLPEIQLEKTANLDDLDGDGFADKGEVITYTYRVTNSGNVALTDVSVSDIHEGIALASGSDIVSETLLSDGSLATGPTGAISSDDGTANNGIWGTLQPGAVVTFTYVHTVTQDEVDGG